MADSDVPKGEGWVKVQQKTFTKWMNTHLRKRGYAGINDAEVDFDTGINLMNLLNALYQIPLPKYSKDPKMRAHRLDNITQALAMLEKAQVKTNFLKSVHLVDHDLKMILGMVWCIILDYQIKGISVEEMTAKEGLLLWCQKKTAGYRDVKVENFTTSWQSGLAFCALIHRHRPDLIDYNSLDKSKPRENLELAFSVAEKELGIARLLDIEDLTDVARPDERSVMTYVSEYFHCFAGMDVKERATARVAKMLAFARSMEELEHDYESRARALLEWIRHAEQRMSERDAPSDAESAKRKFEEHKHYLIQEKPQKTANKLDLESLFAEIQTKLSVYGRHPYVPPPGLTIDDIDAAWDSLAKSEKGRGVAVRDNMYKFITKSTSSVSAEQMKEFEESFRHFDKDGSGQLDRLEFKAALQALSVPFKNEDAFNKVFDEVAQGNPRISKEQFINYLIGLSADKDTPDAIKSAFLVMADNRDTISLQQLRSCGGFQSGDVDYLAAHMPQAADGNYDYRSFTDGQFK